MAVTYAQFIVENPEFSEIPQTMVDPPLLAYDATFVGAFGDATIHDLAVYARTALHLSESVFGMRMSDESTEQNRYRNHWERMLALSHRRGQISGGGLT